MSRNRGLRSRSCAADGRRTSPPTGWRRRSPARSQGPITPDTRFLGGETIGELTGRVIPALEEIVADEAWDTALAVLHGGVNRAILSYALTGERTFFGGFEQAPACINVLDVGTDGRWIVRVVNSAEHLGVTEHQRSTTMEEYYAEYAALRAVEKAAHERAERGRLLEHRRMAGFR